MPRHAASPRKPRQFVLHEGKKQSVHRELRGQIAYLAARMIAMDGMTSLGAARQKAARQLGTTEKGLLPDDHEIEKALRLHQSIFQRNSQPQECRALRLIAVDVMRWLDHFSPWLVGAVLKGTANRFSEIELKIISASAKQVELFFINERVPFETRVKHAGQPRRGIMLNEIVSYEVTFNEIPVVIAHYLQHAARHAHHPDESLKHARAQLAAVEVLLAK